MSFNADVVHVLQMIGAPLPGGDSAQLNNLAEGWNSMATDLDIQAGVLAAAVGDVSPQQWQGEACDAFMKQWQSLHGAMQQGASNFRNVAKCLQSYAQTVDSINEEIVSIAEQILAATAVGGLLTIVTAGISDAVAAAADTAEAARIFELIDDFVEAAKSAGEAIKDFLGISDRLAELIGVFARNFAADFSSDVFSQALSGQQITWTQDLEDGTVDAAGSTLLWGGLSTKINPAISGAATNMAGTFFQDTLVDHDSLGATAENMAESGLTGAAGGHLAAGDDKLDPMTAPQEIATNTILYTGGDVAEGDVNGLSGRISSILGGTHVGGDQMPTVAPVPEPETSI